MAVASLVPSLRDADAGALQTVESDLSRAAGHGQLLRFAPQELLEFLRVLQVKDPLGPGAGSARHPAR